MKKKEKDYEYLETSPEAKAMGLLRISRPKGLKAALSKNSETESRLSMSLASDLFKEELLKDKEFLGKLKAVLAEL